MNDNFTKTYRFMKGVYEAALYDIGTRNLRLFTNKLTDSNFSSTVNVGEIVAGVGNPTVITLPDTANFDITLTSADIDLIYNQLNTGGTLGYNGITQTCEMITASAAALTLTGTPVAPYGSQAVVAYVGGSGIAYMVDPDTKAVQGFTAEVGKEYAVRYYISKASNEFLDIKSLFAPFIGTLEVRLPVFAAVEGMPATTGSLVGQWHLIVPRFQLGGTGGGVQTNQTTPATGVLNGRALAYDNTAAVACTSGTPSLVYMVYEPIDVSSGVTDLVVLGGGELAVAVGKTATIPVRFVMKDGQLSVPLLSDLTYVSAAEPTATVANGVVTGVAAGDTEVTITYAGVTPNLTAACQVTVS